MHRSCTTDETALTKHESGKTCSYLGSRRGRDSATLCHSAPAMRTYTLLPPTLQLSLSSVRQSSVRRPTLSNPSRSR
eukprot:2657110-Pleurochrysis_carterae.AAC.3